MGPPGNIAADSAAGGVTGVTGGTFAGRGIFSKTEFFVRPGDTCIASRPVVDVEEEMVVETGILATETVWTGCSLGEGATPCGVRDALLAGAPSEAGEGKPWGSGR